MAADKSARKNDVITTFYHPFGGSGEHLGVESNHWPVVWVGRWDESRAQWLDVGWGRRHGLGCHVIGVACDITGRAALT